MHGAKKIKFVNHILKKKVTDPEDHP